MPQPRRSRSGSVDQASSTDQADRLSLREKQFGLASAVVGLFAVVASVFGVVQQSGKTDAQDTVASLSAELDTSDRTIGTLRSDLSAARQQSAQADADNQKLQQANAELTRQLEKLGSSVPTVSPTEASATAGAVRRQGALTVAQDSNPFDLDAPASDAQWGSTNTDLPETAFDIRDFTTRLFLIEGAQYVLLGDPPATYDTCSTTTGYQTGNANLRDLGRNQSLCILTNGRRYAGAKIVSFAPRGYGVTLEVTVFEK